MYIINLALTHLILVFSRARQVKTKWFYQYAKFSWITFRVAITSCTENHGSSYCQIKYSYIRIQINSMEFLNFQFSKILYFSLIVYCILSLCFLFFFSENNFHSKEDCADYEKALKLCGKLYMTEWLWFFSAWFKEICLASFGVADTLVNCS